MSFPGILQLSQTFQPVCATHSVVEKRVRGISHNARLTLIIEHSMRDLHGNLDVLVSCSHSNYRIVEKSRFVRTKPRRC